MNDQIFKHIFIAVRNMSVLASREDNKTWKHYVAHVSSERYLLSFIHNSQLPHDPVSLASSTPYNLILCTSPALVLPCSALAVSIKHGGAKGKVHGGKAFSISSPPSTCCPHMQLLCFSVPLGSQHTQGQIKHRGNELGRSLSPACLGDESGLASLVRGVGNSNTWFLYYKASQTCCLIIRACSRNHFLPAAAPLAEGEAVVVLSLTKMYLGGSPRSQEP